MEQENEKASENFSGDFDTLTEIMKRFHSVPFEQFQKELDDWFLSKLDDKGIDKNLIKNKPAALSDLISKIYFNAELLQTLSENQISDQHEDK